MVKLSFLILIMIAGVYGRTISVAERNRVIMELRDLIKQYTFTGAVIACMNPDISKSKNCQKDVILIAQDVLVIANIYELITEKCLLGAYDIPLTNFCEIYRSLRDEFPTIWPYHLQIIKTYVDKRQLPEISMVQIKNYHTWIKNDPYIAVLAATCTINNNSCPGVLDEIRDLLIYAERLGNCELLSDKNKEACSVILAYKTYYRVLLKNILAQGNLWSYENVVNRTIKYKITHDEL